MEQQIKEKLLNNIFPASIAAIENIEEFPWHQDRNRNIDSYKVQSSQALMIDVFGYLSICRNKDKIINTVFNVEDEEWKIIFEYVDEKLLNEPTSTQIDVMLQGKNTYILIECKFTENDGGRCSQPINKKQCNGKYEIQTNPLNNIQNKCALTGKGINYWKYIDLIYDYSSKESYSACPFKGGHYQWMRNLCFAYSLKEKTGKDVKSYICFDDANFCPMKKKFDKNYLSEINQHVKQEYQFNIVTYQKIIESAINISLDNNVWKELKKWVVNKEIKTLSIINNKKI